MSDEDTPLTSNQPPAAAVPLSVENLADSDDANVILARAKLLEAQAPLTTASTPLLDKVIIRGLLPIALAIVGPWALWKFDASQTEQKKQGEVIVQLQTFLEGAQKETASRKARSVRWQARMAKIDEEKAAELTAMTTMVSRLDDMLKIALIQQAVLRLLDTKPRGPSGAAPQPASRARVIRETTEQVQLPGVAPADLEKLAGEQYDKILEQRRKR